jgi:hypothetical protein
MNHIGVLCQEGLHLHFGHLSLGLAVNLISQHHKWEFFGLLRSTLINELVLPRLEVLEALSYKATTLALVMS